jgi:hypothetical protein
MSLIDQAGKPFNTRKFVRETLTLPPELSCLNRRSATVDALLERIDQGIRFCRGKIRSTNPSQVPHWAYEDAIGLLETRRRELTPPYGYGKRPSSPERKPYSARYGFAVINDDGVPRATYA